MKIFRLQIFSENCLSEEKSSNEDFKTAKVCEIEQEDEMMNHHKQKSDIERHKKSCSDYHL
jgi:hypothetical protein